MTDSNSVVVLSDDSESEESTTSKISSNQDSGPSSSNPPKKNIAVKRGIPLPPQQQPPKIRKDFADVNQLSSQFLADFNPLNSQRERNKHKPNQYTKFIKKNKKSGQNQAYYDDKGKLRINGLDICDCFDEKCAGCHFPCEWCGSNKCGLKCRNNRRYMYDAIEFDGKDKIINNPWLAIIK